MKALILNSGLGTRLGCVDKDIPKCMTEIDGKETILSRQLKMLLNQGITEVVITTGFCENILRDYCTSLNLSQKITFVNNKKYAETNYIYSIFCAENELQDDIILLHGDLVFSEEVLKKAVGYKKSCMVVSSTDELPQKDFKAVIEHERITKIGIEFFDNAMAAQPLYKLELKDWKNWLSNIHTFCMDGKTKCYAENAFNEISDKCDIKPLDVKDQLCKEIDTLEDFKKVLQFLH